MANSVLPNRRALKVATILASIGLMLILVGSLITGEWPDGFAVMGPILALTAAALLWYSQEDGGAKGSGGWPRLSRSRAGRPSPRSPS